LDSTGRDFSSFLDKAASRQAKLSLAIRKLAPRIPLLTNVYPLSEYVSKTADEVEAIGILRVLPSYAWIGTTPPIQRTDITFGMEVRDFYGKKSMTGALSPTNIFEPDDVMVLSDKSTGSLLTAILPPTGMNYPGKPEGTFDVRFDTATIGSLKPDACDLLLARPRTHEVWRLSRR